MTELAASMSVPVGIDVTVDRLPGAVEATACFVIAEALMNLVKHPRASRAAVTAAVAGRTLRLHVRDDGVGGAQADGSGLVGLSDRLAALGGRLRVDSPAGGGTLIAASIPATDPRPADVPVPRAPDRGDEDAGEGRTGA